MLHYISYAVLVLVALFMFIIVAVESSPRNEEFIWIIGIVMAIVMATALSVGGYNQYKYDIASVEKANNIEIVDKKTTDIGYETIVKYRDKTYKSIDKDLYKSVKIGEKMKGHVVEGTNKLHDVDGYAVTEK